MATRTTKRAKPRKVATDKGKAAKPRPTSAHLKKRALLAAFAEGGTILHACRAVGVGRRTHYGWMASDPAYAEAFADAREQAADALEAEARRRAVEGVEEPVYQGGKQVGTIRRYSDTLLIFLLKGARPEKYRDRVTAEHTGPGGGPLRVTHEVDTLTPEERDDLIRHAAAALADDEDSESA